jgi:hypothetical protein
MFNIFYKKPFLNAKTNVFSTQKIFQSNKINLDKLDKNKIQLLNYKIDYKLPQPPPKRNTDIFIFLSISYFIYIMFYYSKYKYINI